MRIHGRTVCQTPHPAPPAGSTHGAGTYVPSFRRTRVPRVVARYERLALLLADQPGLAEPLLAARPLHRRAILLFAAVQYLLRTAAPDHPLAAYFPTLGGYRTPDEGLEKNFTNFMRGYGEQLRDLCATRTTQTNEARRAALLRPGFGLVARLAAGRPLTLVELGTSVRGRPTVDVLARTGPHGEWLEWVPATYPYAPPHTRSTA